MSNKAYRVIKCESNRFIIDLDGEQVACLARKKVKNNLSVTPDKSLNMSGGVIKKMGGIVAGDYCYIENIDGELVLHSVAKRKNFLLRPNVANIDTLVIVAAATPQIDFFLIDKLIINAHRQNLDIVLCLNKGDLSDAQLSNLTTQYAESVDHIILISAINKEIEPLKNILCGKLSCLAGQSAVGKSTIVNALLNFDRQQTGELSKSIMRGKNTTTASEIIVVDKDTYILDTPGFSMIDICDILSNELCLYYPEFTKHAHECKYGMCSHIAEPECKVKELVNNGQIDLQRYQRYVIMVNELKEFKRY